MGNYVTEQLSLFGQSILLGLMAGLCYDLLRPLRQRLTRLSGVLDGLYGVTAFSCIFLFVLHRGAGELRLYLLLGIVGGMALFFGIFSAPLRPLWDFWTDTGGDVVRLLLFPISALYRLCGKIEKNLKNLFYFCKKCYMMKQTGRIQRRVDKDSVSKTEKSKKSRRRIP